MTINADFLKMLVCPTTRKPLRLASAAELQRVNDRIAGQQAKNRGGAAVTTAVASGLVPEGEAVLYPILEGIPILLSSEAIPLDSADAAAPHAG
jgi:uncharacterized protein YbaR (Trm112 family)